MKSKNIVKKMVPEIFKRFIRKCTGISGIHENLQRLEKEISNIREIIYSDDIWDRSKSRWRKSDPDEHLTWGIKISGDKFIRKASGYNIFSKEKSILEIGTGYGRLLKSCLKMNIPFSEYVGLDISKKTVEYLNKNYSSSNIHFILGDAETISLPKKFDILISSLTFKHLFPSFEKALKNISSFLNIEGMLFFDMVEGKNRTFEYDLATYIREYTKDEIKEILKNLSLQWLDFDYVKHAPNYTRLIVIAKKL